MTNTAPEPEGSFDEFDGDDVHENHVGEEVLPDEDPNMKEGRDGD